MKQGISIERTYDLHDRLVVRILKRRGRLTLEEVSDLLRLEGGGEWSGWYAVLLNCTEGTIGGNGLSDSEDTQGDGVPRVTPSTFTKSTRAMTARSAASLSRPSSIARAAEQSGATPTRTSRHSSPR